MRNYLRFYIYTLLTFITVGNTTITSAYSDDEIFEEQTIAVSPSGEFLAAKKYISLKPKPITLLFYLLALTVQN